MIKHYKPNKNHLKQALPPEKKQYKKKKKEMKKLKIYKTQK